MADKLPWFPFYAESWMTHDKLRACSSAARGLWIDLLCLMHKNDRRGYLQLSGKPLALEQLARMTGRSTEEVSQQLAELLDSGVASVTEHGIVFSRRMVRDECKRQKCSAAGKKGGGNPKMKRRADQEGLSEWQRSPGFVYAIRRMDDQTIKLGASVDPQRRKTSGHGSLRYIETSLIRSWPVLQMGPAEGAVHEFFKDKCVGGEWFRLEEVDLEEVERFLTLKGLLKGGSKGRSKGLSSSSSRSPPSSESTAAGGAGGAEMFDRFWSMYPRKKSKEDARKAWVKLRVDEQLLAFMLTALEQQKKGWTDPKYIPHPATWLNGRRWEDEPDGPRLCIVDDADFFAGLEAFARKHQEETRNDGSGVCTDHGLPIVVNGQANAGETG